jgi:hypothetical protein
VERWNGGTVVRWYGGTVVRWYGGTVVRWYGGTVVRWNAQCPRLVPFVAKGRDQTGCHALDVIGLIDQRLNEVPITKL